MPEDFEGWGDWVFEATNPPDVLSSPVFVCLDVIEDMSEDILLVCSVRIDLALVL